VIDGEKGVGLRAPLRGGAGPSELRRLILDAIIGG